MSTIQTLTIGKIEIYQELVKSSGIGAVPGVYKALSEMGFGYAVGRKVFQLEQISSIVNYVNQV